MTTFWAELSLTVHGDESETVAGFMRRVAKHLVDAYDGDVTYTVSPTQKTAHLGMSYRGDVRSDVPAIVMGAVRAAVHACGGSTAGWPEPATTDDVSVSVFEHTEASLIKFGYEVVSAA